MGFTNLKLGQVNPFAVKNDFGNVQTNPLSQGKQTINFSDGVYQPSGDVEDISSELGALMSELGITKENGVQETKDTPVVEGDKEVDKTKQKEIQDKIEELQDKYDKNLEKMEKLKGKIEELIDKVSETVIKAAAAKEEAIKQNEELYQKLVDDELKAYVEANKEGGKGMTHEELLKNIDDALSHVPNIASAIKTALEANRQLSELTSCAGILNGLIFQNQDLAMEISQNNQLLNANDSKNSTLDGIGALESQTNNDIDTIQDNVNTDEEVDDSPISNLNSSNNINQSANSQYSKNNELEEYENLAGYTFYYANQLRDDLDEILNAFGYEPSKTTIEYTNSVAFDTTQDIFDEIRNVGKEEEEEKKEKKN